MSELYAGKPDPAVYDYLTRRRSAKKLAAPGPDDGQVQMILQAAARVPDHGKLFPWYFLVFKGDARRGAGDILKRAWLAREPDASPAKLELEGERFLNAPVVIGVVSTIRESKIPAWEQILSAGAACMTLCLAANALGFASNWLTGWYSYDEAVKKELGLGDHENIAGFIHLGTAAEQPEERERADLSSFVTNWEPGIALRTGK